MRDKISCAGGTLQDLCQVACPNEVCGTCSYCGRPICQDHGWHDTSEKRYYCEKHGPQNNVSFIVGVMKMALAIQAERRTPLIEISDEELVRNILRRLRKESH